jgi:hypothetical protein
LEPPVHKVVASSALSTPTGPRNTPDGDLALALPLGGVKLPGIAAENIGRCAYGVFRHGLMQVGSRQHAYPPRAAA